MEELHIVRKAQLHTHDVYQFSYARDFDPEHIGPDSFWLENALYLCDSPWDMGALAPFIQQVLPDFAWYGWNKVTLAQWSQIQALFLMERPLSFRFFREVRQWLEEGNQNADYFWILGP